MELRPVAYVGLRFCFSL